MNAKRMGLLFATGAIVVVSSVARSAFAGEVTVFADRDFKGNAMTVRGPSPNLERPVHARRGGDPAGGI